MFEKKRGRGGERGSVSARARARRSMEDPPRNSSFSETRSTSVPSSSRPSSIRLRSGSLSDSEGATPRRKGLGGIDRGKQFFSDNGGRRKSKNAGGRGQGIAGGLSEKTLNIVTNLTEHTGKTAKTKQEQQDLEEEVRQAAEERRIKEALRAKGEGEVDLTIRVLLLGDSGVGKTSLMMRYSEDQFAPNMLSTAGVDFKIHNLQVKGRKVRCQVWDTAGQDKFHVITRAYYRGAHGIALVYDVTDRDSFKNVNYWIANIHSHSGAAAAAALAEEKKTSGKKQSASTSPKGIERIGIRTALLGNKVDLLSQREISLEEGKAAGEEFNVPHFEVSAKHGTGVRDAFQALACDIVDSLDNAAAHSHRMGAKSGRYGTEKCTVC